MKIIKATTKYLQEAVDIAFESYRAQCKHVEAIGNCSKDEISKEIFVAFQNQNGILCLDNDKLVGYLIYRNHYDINETLWCNIPLCGYGAVGQGKSRVKIISVLFQKLAEELCTDKKVHFEIKLYAYDNEIIKLFSFLQFGIQCEEGIRFLDNNIPFSTVSNIREFTKEEIQMSWKEIWGLLKGLIEHLQTSPVFYPGIEFTEDVYKGFLLDKDVKLVASEVEGEIVGIITANKDGNSFINNKSDCFNVGDAYVVPKYRESMLAQSMLNYLSEILAKEGAGRLWVEHGTANPNARGFWNKYFTTYGYTMIRDVELF